MDVQSTFRTEPLEDLSNLIRWFSKSGRKKFYGIRRIKRLSDCAIRITFAEGDYRHQEYVSGDVMTLNIHVN